jgi:adenosylmethionine-8-amino-7-oxononanoate aminotransferase
MKMAIQYWHAAGTPDKTRFLTIRSGYHGDTFHAMAVTDPVNGMHTLFQEVLPEYFFADQPRCRYGTAWDERDLESFKNLIEQHRDRLAAVILEPIVQGAGGMYFYAPEYLAGVRRLCDEHNVLLIHDEIATGFGRTGRMFACEHAAVTPDIMCVGKALTGGYMTLAAAMTTAQVASVISSGDPGVFMHGPTFMANPLACGIAAASIRLLKESPWQMQIAHIERTMTERLAACRDCDHVADVRALGGIGVIELTRPVNMARIQQRFVDHGVWIRPFGRLVYIMPPYVIGDDDLDTLLTAMAHVVKSDDILA